MKHLKIALIAGEHSGDILGADLMSELSQLAAQHSCTIEYKGIAGPKMMALGCESYFDMDELAVMGLVEILKRLPRLLKKRKQLIQDLANWQPDVVVGIDAPEFNLELELQLRQKGFKTVHYVSPSVWAWRQSRVFKIKQACDLVLALLPFEKAFYDKYDVPCQFVGHTTADRIPLEDQQDEYRQKLSIKKHDKVLGVLPGSRGSELKFLLRPFLTIAKQLQQEIPELIVLIPAVNEKRFNAIKQVLQEPEFSTLKTELSVGNATDVMAASDAVLLASGTATLETMLMKTPMVAAYRVGWLSYQVFSRLIKTPYFTLPNLLAQKELVPELIQHDLTTEKAVSLLRPLLLEPQNEIKQQYTELHQLIKHEASKTAATCIMNLVESK